MYVPSAKPVMLAKHLHKVPEKKRVFPAVGSEKFDGVYCYGLITKDDNRIFSRTGMEYTSLGHLSNRLATMAEYVGFKEGVLIFEAWHPEMTVHKISGDVRRNSPAPHIVAKVHDWIPFDDFVAGASDMQFKYRTMVAEEMCDVIGDHWMQYVDQFPIDTEAVAQEVFRAFVDNIDFYSEGIILRNPDAGWVAGKRNADLVKIKLEESADLRVVGINGGEGKYAGTTGTIVVDYKGKHCPISGMSDYERGIWFADPSIIMGQIVEVQFMCETPDGMMREPRFKMIRHDKDTPDE